MKTGLLDIVKSELKENSSNIISNQDPLVILKHIEQLQKQKLNILFVGATGVGKSSTINAIFDTEVARVGYSADPETSSIQKYEIDNMILWDTPGFGDNPQKDKRYALEIANALKQKNNEGHLLIDGVVVLIDASNRDMKTSYEIIENIIVPYMDDKKRIIVAINQCDMALKGRYWNHENNQPEEQLTAFLDEKVLSVKNRIQESTGIPTEPMFYSALYKYNISKLLLAILKNIPEKKRFLLADSLNKSPDIWKRNDSLQNYNVEIKKEIRGSLSKALDGAAKGAAAGATVGGLIPIVGPVIGVAVGAFLGFLGGFSE